MYFKGEKNTEGHVCNAVFIKDGELEVPVIVDCISGMNRDDEGNYLYKSALYNYEDFGIPLERGFSYW